MSDSQQSGPLGQCSPAELPLLNDGSVSKLSATSSHVYVVVVAGVGGVLYRKYHSDPQKEETHPGSYK